MQTACRVARCRPMERTGKDETVERIPRGFFVSHANADQTLVEILVRTLVEGGLSSDSITYTSRPDLGIGAGALFPLWIREEIRNSGLVLTVVSSTYLTRPWCLMELGAAFVLPDNTLFPVLLPSVGNTDERIPRGLQACAISDKDSISDMLWMLYERLRQRVDGSLRGDRWNRAVKHFAPLLTSALADHPSARSPLAGINDPEYLLSIDLRRAFEHWDTNGRSHHHIAPQDLRRRAALAAKGGWRPDDDSLEFLIFSSSYDGEMLSPVTALASDAGWPIGATTAASWFSGVMNRPKYRIAMAVECFHEEHRLRIADMLANLPDLNAVGINLAKAIRSQEVRRFILNSTLSTDLDEGKRQDLIEHWHQPRL